MREGVRGVEVMEAVIKEEVVEGGGGREVVLAWKGVPKEFVNI